jgi:hypothetical protein
MAALLKSTGPLLNHPRPIPVLPLARGVRPVRASLRGWGSFSAPPLVHRPRVGGFDRYCSRRRYAKSLCCCQPRNGYPRKQGVQSVCVQDETRREMMRAVVSDMRPPKRSEASVEIAADFARMPRRHGRNLRDLRSSAFKRAISSTASLASVANIENTTSAMAAVQ